MLAVHDQVCSDLMNAMLEAALYLVPLDTEVNRVDTLDGLLEHVAHDRDDVVFLDWDLAGEDTPRLVEEITASHPLIRIVALLPLELRQYRQRLWEVGACSCVPKEHMDQEWLSSVLCLTYRTMCREAYLLSEAHA